MANRRILRVYFSPHPHPHRPSVFLCSRFVACSEIRVIGRSGQGYRLRNEVSHGVGWRGTPNREWFVNHPLVRRKLLATFSLRLTNRCGGRGRGGRLVKNVEGCRSLATSRSFPSLSPFAFKPFWNSSPFPPRTRSFSFFRAFHVILSRVLTSLIRFPPFPFPRTMFSSVSCFSSILFFLRFLSATYFSFALPPFHPHPRPISLRDRVGVDIGSICVLPRATITCNTVGLSGPMGTRRGVLSP